MKNRNGRLIVLLLYHQQEMKEHAIFGKITKQYNRQTLGLVLVMTATNILYFGSIVSMF